MLSCTFRVNWNISPFRFEGVSNILEEDHELMKKLVIYHDAVCRTALSTLSLLNMGTDEEEGVVVGL